MRSSDEARSRLRSLTTLQAGVVSRQQAHACGVSDRVISRLVAVDQWRRLGPGVFSTTEAEPTFLGRAWAGVLLGGEGARVGLAGAGHLQKIVDDEPDVITVFVPHGRGPDPRGSWQFQRERPGVRDPRILGDPPRTCVDDTVLDLCLDRHVEDVVGVVTAAVQRRRTTPRRLRRALDRRSRHPHRALLADLLADVGMGAESPLEVAYLRDVERAHGLPRGQRQQPSVEHPAVRDVWYVEHGVVSELDGRLGHTEMGRFRDMNRDNLAGLDGLLTLRYGGGDVYGFPCGVMAQVARGLQQRGWRGIPTRCPRCLLVPDR